MAKVLNDVFFECIKHDGIVSVASVNAEGQAHIANTWNKYLVVTDNEEILMPCFGFTRTQKNVENVSPRVEVTIGSHEVQGKMGMGTGCLLFGKAQFVKEGPLFDTMKAKYKWASRVLVFTPESCKQTI